MGVGIGENGRSRKFERFLVEVEPRLRRALVATYGPVDGREAAQDALSWAWEHWDRMADVRHPVAYLYRVGQSAVRRFGSRPLPADLLLEAAVDFPDISPELWPALGRLSSQQRTIVRCGPRSAACHRNNERSFFSCTASAGLSPRLRRCSR